MIRSELCAIAQMAIPTFNSNKRNGDLPFDLFFAEAKDGAGRVWSRYDYHNAMLMIAARKLCDAQGVTWSEAAKILREKPTHVGSADIQAEPGVCRVRVEFLRCDGEESGFLKRFTVYEGKLDEVIASAQRSVEVINGRQAFASEHIEIGSVVAVNLSTAFVMAVHRAEDLGIALTSDGEPEPGQE